MQSEENNEISGSYVDGKIIKIYNRTEEMFVFQAINIKIRV